MLPVARGAATTSTCPCSSSGGALRRGRAGARSGSGARGIARAIRTSQPSSSSSRAIQSMHSRSLPGGLVVSKRSSCCEQLHRAILEGASAGTATVSRESARSGTAFAGLFELARRWYYYGYAPRDVDRRDQLRHGHRAREALQRARPQDACASTSSPARRGVRIVQKRVDPQTGEEVPYEDIVKGYEIAPGPLRRDRAGRARGARAEEDEDDRDRGLRRALPDRPGLLRPPLLPRARPRRRQALPPAAGGDARDRQGRDRARGDPLQGAARRDPPDGRRAGDGDDDLRRRSAAARAPRRGRARRQRSRRPSASSTSPSSSSTRSPATSSRERYQRHLPRGGARR